LTLYWKNTQAPETFSKECMPERDYPDDWTYLRPLWEIRIQTIEVEPTGSLYTSMPNLEENITIQPDVPRTNPLMSISWTNIAFIGLTIPFEYLVPRCAGHSMTDITRLLENPVEAMTIVQNFVLKMLYEKNISEIIRLISKKKS
jgi:hypothetical protein